MTNINSERAAVGLELHCAETAIGAGRLAVRELLACEPIDLQAVEQQRAVITEARLARNSLRTRLIEIKARGTKPPKAWVS